jgi:hypothetical protein
MIIENNEIFGCNEAHIYVIDGLNTHIRGNLIYGTEIGPNSPNVPDGFGPGIWVGSENHPCSSYLADDNFDINPRIYGNVVANCSNNLLITEQADAAHSVGNVIIANNTFVAGKSIDARFRPDMITGNNIQIKNNIFWRTGSSSAITNTVPDSNGVFDFDYNLWSEQPYADYRGPNDPSYALPGIYKTTDWSPGTNGYVNFLSFELQEGSPAIDTGTAGVGAVPRYLPPSTNNSPTRIDHEDYVDNYMARYSGDVGPDIGGIPYDGGGSAPAPSIGKDILDQHIPGSSGEGFTLVNLYWQNKFLSDGGKYLLIYKR